MPTINEAWFDNAQARHDAADARWLSRMERRWNDADAQIGELVRDGKTVCYAYPQGGKYREGERADLVDFLIRNNYA